MSGSSTASSSPPVSSPPPSAQETDASMNQGAGEGVVHHTSPMRISSSPMKSDSEESDEAIKHDDRSERSSDPEITLELPARRDGVNIGGDDRTQPHVAAGDGSYNARSLVSQEQTGAARTTPTSGQRILPSHPARDRKRRLTSTAEQGRLQRTRSGEMSRSSVQPLPHRSASMINPSSRGKANSAASGSSWSTAIDITSSPPEAGPSGNQRQGNRQLGATAMPIRSSKVGSASSQGYGQVHIDAALRADSSLSRNTDNPLPSLPWEARSRTRHQIQENDPRAGASWESVSSASAPRPRRRQYSNSLRDSMFEQHSQTGRQRGMSDAMRNSRNERVGGGGWQLSGTDERTLRAFLSGSSDTQTLAEALRNPHNEADMEPTLPPWQPDAEVTSCPICAVVFNFWHRKHHCRKCGRVVCASCSPHRITIPRQYIVRPPESSQPLESSPAPPRQIVDLTSDDDSIPIIQSINPALGGGEEVRLCNPCVPDPNPNPLGYGVRSRGHRSTNSLPSGMGNYISSEEETASNNQAHRGYSPEFLQELGYNVRQSLRDQGPERNGSRHHHHHHSQSELPSPRHSATMTASPRRPTVSEQDLCPICGRRFPDISSEQPLEAREAHIRQCIENYGAPVATTPAPTSTRRGPAPPPPPPPPPPVARMLEFTATEKDCIGEDAGPAECPICLVEYEVGDVLIRLECLCKFHKHCILGWFERKMECPTHKVS